MLLSLLLGLFVRGEDGLGRVAKGHGGFHRSLTPTLQHLVLF